MPVSLLIVAVPGPSVVFTVGRALSAGRRSALATVLGNGVGVFAQAVVIAVGLGTVLASVTWAFIAIKVTGGCYLIWLGIEAIRHRHVTMEAADTPQQFLLTDFRTGVTVGLTNPKTLIFLYALLPAFVPSGASTVPQMLLLGTIFAAVAVAGDSVWAIPAGTARAWFTQSPRRIGRLRTAGGAIQIGLGTYTVATGAKL